MAMRMTSSQSRSRARFSGRCTAYLPTCLVPGLPRETVHKESTESVVCIRYRRDKTYLRTLGRTAKSGIGMLGQGRCTTRKWRGGATSYYPNERPNS